RPRLSALVNQSFGRLEAKMWWVARHHVSRDLEFSPYLEQELCNTAVSSGPPIASSSGSRRDPNQHTKPSAVSNCSRTSMRRSGCASGLEHQPDTDNGGK